ncbi:hypothetical protein GDO86_010817 [Hymenochirus boettgeri]|uniref:Carboxypeptidase Q n=1 Tax=Hymenochirus boettgeri TaxID=247094 RepID=A0A8T2JGR9_9PIPI|nr:hypothetical protein GDO86_010817 [Hymenochirus boettgeri]
MKFLLLTLMSYYGLQPSFGFHRPKLPSQRTFETIKNEISGYKDIAKSIINLAVHGKAQNRSYERLALFVDSNGNRVSGSTNLENAIKYMYKELQKDGLDRVALEPVKVPHWVRGEETAMMIEPRKQNIAILGLGGSIGTPAEGISAEIILVSSFAELHNRSKEAKGKIVVYNEPFISYGETVRYRGSGAVEAAKVGAVASLIRSVTPFSIYREVCVPKDGPDGLWTGEEQGGVGAQQYYDLHKSDMGTFMPLGIQFRGNSEAQAIMAEVMKLLEPINVTKLYDNAEGTDKSTIVSFYCYLSAASSCPVFEVNAIKMEAQDRVLDDPVQSYWFLIGANMLLTENILLLNTS